jgi:hypothetical protein
VAPQSADVARQVTQRRIEHEHRLVMTGNVTLLESCHWDVPKSRQLTAASVATAASSKGPGLFWSAFTPHFKLIDATLHLKSAHVVPQGAHQMKNVFAFAIMTTVGLALVLPTDRAVAQEKQRVSFKAPVQIPNTRSSTPSTLEIHPGTRSEFLRFIVPIRATRR